MLALYEKSNTFDCSIERRTLLEWGMQPPETASRIPGMFPQQFTYISSKFSDWLCVLYCEIYTICTGFFNALLFCTSFCIFDLLEQFGLLSVGYIERIFFKYSLFFVLRVQWKLIHFMNVENHKNEFLARLCKRCSIKRKSIYFSCANRLEDQFIIDLQTIKYVKEKAAYLNGAKMELNQHMNQPSLGSQFSWKNWTGLQFLHGCALLSTSGRFAAYNLFDSASEMLLYSMCSTKTESARMAKHSHMRH